MDNVLIEQLIDILIENAKNGKIHWLCRRELTDDTFYTIITIKKQIDAAGVHVILYPDVKIKIGSYWSNAPFTEYTSDKVDRLYNLVKSQITNFEKEQFIEDLEKVIQFLKG